MTVWASPWMKTCTCPGSQLASLTAAISGALSPGQVFGHQVGPAAAVDPSHLDARRCAERDLVLGSGNLDEDLANCVVGQGLQRGADGRNGRLVAGEQVPVGRGVGRVGAAGPHQVGRLTRGGRGRPRPGDAVLAVHDEVDGDLAALGVDVAHGVGADGGPLFGG